MAKRETDAKPTLKFILLGDSGVGKTNIFLRITEHRFQDGECTTLGCDYRAVDLPVDDQVYSVRIWDTAGQERFRGIVESYYRGAQGILLVYDQSVPSSFDALPGWLDSIESRAEPDVPVIVVANKKDLPETVPYHQASDWAEQKGLEIVATSAKTGEEIDTAFLRLARLAIGKEGAIPEAEKPRAIELNSGAAKKKCKC